MAKPKGGAGKKNPVQMVRIPLAIKDQIVTIRDKYYDDGQFPLDQGDGLPPMAEAVIHAKRIMGHKKSARVSMERLLTALYGEPVDLPQ